MRGARSAKQRAVMIMSVAVPRSISLSRAAPAASAGQLAACTRVFDKVRVREKILWVRTLGDCLVARRIRRLAGDDPSRRREPEREWRRKIPLGCAPEATVLSSVASSGKTRGRWPFEKGVGTGKAQGPPPGKAQRPPHAEAHAGGEGPGVRLFVHRHEPAGGPAESGR